MPLSLREARIYGLTGATAQSISYAVLLLAYLSGQTPLATQFSALSIAVGLLGLVAFIGNIGALESISKSLSERSVIDSYVLALAFSAATAAVSSMIGLTQPMNMWPIKATGSLQTINLSIVNLVLPVAPALVESALVVFCFFRVSKFLGNNLFMVAGIVSALSLVPRVFLGSMLFDLAPFLLVAAFLTTPKEMPSKGEAAAWTDVPKALMSRPQSYSSLWFTDEAIFRVRPVLANVKYVVWACTYAVGFVAQSIYQHFDVNGNLSPPTSAETAFEGAAVFALLVGFVVLSRYRYARFAPEEATNRAIERIPWGDISSVTVKGRQVTVLAQKEYVARGDKRQLAMVDALAKQRLAWESAGPRAPPRLCPNCGAEALDRDVFCRRCGHPIQVAEKNIGLVWASPEAPKPSHKTRNMAIVAASLLVVSVVLGATIIQPFNSPVPISTIASVVKGDRTRGYTASFFLLNTDGHIVASSGNVSITIMDYGLKVLYRSTFHLDLTGFNVENHTISSNGQVTSGPGYLWRIPSSSLAPASEIGGSLGRASVSFVTTAGENITMTGIEGFTV